MTTLRMTGSKKKKKKSVVSILSAEMELVVKINFGLKNVLVTFSLY